MRIDPNAFVGEYPFRRLPDVTPAALLRAMDRVGIDQAWISHLSAFFWREPGEGNPLLYRIAAEHPRLKAVPAVHPELPDWKLLLGTARSEGAPAVRCDPTFYGIHAAGGEMYELAHACSEAGLPLMMATRLEDSRQRHPNDTADPLPPWAVRSLIRAIPGLRLIVTHADREFVEQVHFGSTPEEASRILWDICWIWGPPEDHLATLLETVGVERFTFGTGAPLRLPENSVCKLDLLDLSAAERHALESGNLTAFIDD